MKKRGKRYNEAASLVDKAKVYTKEEACKLVKETSNNIERELVIYSNILIGVFNLIPIYPLDGGRILKEIIHILKGLNESYTYINVISNASIIMLTIFSSIGIFYLKNIAILFIIGYLWYLVINQNRLYNQRLKIYEIINSGKSYDEEIEQVHN